MNKRAITILGAIFLLIIGTLGFLIYQRRKTADTSGQTTPPVATVPPITETPVTPPSTPTAPSPENPEIVPSPPGVTPTPVDTGSNGLQPSQLATDNVVSPVLFYQGNGIAYFNTQGQLFQADLDASESPLKLTNKRELGVPAKPGLTRIDWPLAGNNYLAEIRSASGKQWSVYLSDKGVYADLPGQVTAVNWMPDGERLIYLWQEGNKTNLNISPADMSTWQVITDIWENDDDIAMSPDGKVILFWRTGSKDAGNKINMVTPDGKLFRSVVKDGFNKGAVWSQDSQKFLFNKKMGSSWQLWVASMFSGESQSLGVDAAVENAIWSADSRYVYAATVGAGGSGQIFQIDVASGTQKPLPLAKGFEATQMFISGDGRYLYFKNVTDGGLYYINTEVFTTVK